MGDIQPYSIRARVRSQALNGNFQVTHKTTYDTFTFFSFCSITVNPVIQLNSSLDNVLANFKLCCYAVALHQTQADNQLSSLNWGRSIEPKYQNTEKHGVLYIPAYQNTCRVLRKIFLLFLHKTTVLYFVVHQRNITKDYSSGTEPKKHIGHEIG